MKNTTKIIINDIFVNFRFTDIISKVDHQITKIDSQGYAHTKVIACKGEDKSRIGKKGKFNIDYLVNKLNVGYYKKQ